MIGELLAPLAGVGGGGGIVPRGTRVTVFQEIYWVFLVLGTLVGVVVLAYTFYNAYKYRDREGREDDLKDAPQLGELPSGGGKGKKLFLSFALSAIIVVSLVLWTYATLLYVEGTIGDASAQPAAEEPVEVEVIGYQFGWRFVYPNGYESRGTLRVPEDRRIELQVTSEDVWHNFGIPAQRIKNDAIPGQTTEAWFIAEQTGTYQAACYELCGAGHSNMNADVIVMEQSEYQEWYGNTTTPTPTPTATPEEEAAAAGGHSE
jgi:cytochrome c oxidase subunit 2